jgi:excisionase family DNA binding protein
MAEQPRSPYWTVAETAAYLRVGVRTVYRMVDRGDLDYIQTSARGTIPRRGVRITRASVEALLRTAEQAG